MALIWGFVNLAELNCSDLSLEASFYLSSFNICTLKVWLIWRNIFNPFLIKSYWIIVNPNHLSLIVEIMNFSAFQILREINFEEFHSSETTASCHFWALTFVNLVILILQKGQKLWKIKFRASKNVKNSIFPICMIYLSRHWFHETFLILLNLRGKISFSQKTYSQNHYFCSSRKFC